MEAIAQWDAIASRVEGFLQSVTLWSQFPSALATGVQGRHLYKQARAIVADIDKFSVEALGSFPSLALRSLAHDRLREITRQDSVGISTDGIVAEAAVCLSTILGEVRYALSDHDEALSLLADRAFLHLQWSIAADRVTMEKWAKAFVEGEPACEKLGATHLLWHGLFSFKAHSGAITDSVLGEPVGADRASVARGLVLTEWKRLDGQDLSKLISAAEVQADMYASGVLGGAELRSVRYVVVVSKLRTVMPPDTPRGSFVYRHINIAVEPESPSIAAPKVVRSAKT